MPIREAAVTAGLDRTSRLARAAAVRRTCRSSVYITLAFLSVFYTGCAYFNTFYHAEQSYKKAQKVQRESKSEKLSPQAAKHYDDAIEKCGKVIKIHGGGWRAGIDDALYLMGVSYYGKKEYQTSIKTLNDLILRYRDSDHIPDALFYTGLCYHKMRNYATARRIFERLLRLHPDFHRRDEIMITAAEGLEAAGDEEGALYQYRAIVTGFNKSKQREEALERVGEICFEAGQYDSALVAYEELGRITRDDERYFEAQLRAGASLVRLGRHDDAMGVYERIMPENPDRDEQGGSVWLAMAEVENRRGNHEDAIEYLKRVSENFANRNMGLEADFRLGYAYEVHLKEYELAREAYQKTCGSRQRSVFKDQAAVRLKNLEHLEELQSSLEEEATDLDRKAEAALKMAEFTLFETADPRGALEQYTEVEESFPESPSAVNAAYARGWILRSELDSLDAAAAVFETLIERYPASRQAEFSLTFLEETGVPRERLEALTDLVHKERAKAQAIDDSLAAAAAADSIAAADSVAAVQALADSLAAAARAEADSVAAVVQAEADSVAATRAQADSVATATATDAAAAQALADSVAVAPDSAGVGVEAPVPDSAGVGVEAPVPDSAGVGVEAPVPDSAGTGVGTAAPDSAQSGAGVDPPDSQSVVQEPETP